MQLSLGLLEVVNNLLAVEPMDLQTSQGETNTSARYIIMGAVLVDVARCGCGHVFVGVTKCGVNQVGVARCWWV